MEEMCLTWVLVGSQAGEEGEKVMCKGMGVGAGKKWGIGLVRQIG